MNELIPAADMKNLFPGTDDQYWASLRHRGTGPVFVKVVRKVFYARADVNAWIEANRFTRPDKPATAATGKP